MMRNPSLDLHRLDVVKDAHGTVLEIGFGSGLNLPYYSNIEKLYALEPSRELFDLAGKDNLFPIEHLHAFAENIPLPDNSIDAAVSTWTMCSIPDVPGALQEIQRVLKPGGKLFFIEHGKSSRSGMYFLQKIFTPFSKRFAGGCHMDRDVERLILDSGFVIEKIEKFEQKSKPLGFMYKGVAVVGK